jgi:hypothetical protein
VRLYPKKNASPIDRTIVVKFGSPAAVPITMPAISPIAQPVRQCRVALSAKPLSAPPSAGISWLSCWAAESPSVMARQPYHRGVSVYFVP